MHWQGKETYSTSTLISWCVWIEITFYYKSIGTLARQLSTKSHSGIHHFLSSYGLHAYWCAPQCSMSRPNSQNTSSERCHRENGPLTYARMIWIFETHQERIFCVLLLFHFSAPTIEWYHHIRKHWFNRKTIVSHHKRAYFDGESIGHDSDDVWK